MTDLQMERRVRLHEEREIVRPHQGRLWADIGPLLISRGARVEGGASPAGDQVLWR